ncbi:uncharacterized protein LOC107865644 [Capsicum annuum]|uniref:uncharacterized protein LOC107865644 n=1 Tax=Capsicum annuum TaxID=4072 RepID=UPI001FB1367A|nr:uncharacterized protein LOC107865644 [Capsicum annuum]
MQSSILAPEEVYNYAINRGKILKTIGSKSFVLIVFAIFLVITSKVAARELSQSSTTSRDNGYGGYFPGYGYARGYPRGGWYGGLPRN